MNLQRTFRAVCLSLLCGLLLCDCAMADGPSLSEVKKFDAYAVYYSGEEVAGLPLESILGNPAKDQGNQSSCCGFYYGDCDPPQEGEGGCPLPIEIQVSSTCRRWASAIHRAAHLYGFRGAMARGHGKGIEDPIEVFTGRTTVVIFSESQKLAIAALRQLRNVRSAHVPPQLPPPAPGSLQGKLPCQRKPG